jgi:aminobenzoyl-glutamate utilization protein B
MTWHAPTARFYMARPALRGGPYPAWAMNALGGIRATIDPTVQAAAQVLAVSALRVLMDKSARDSAMREFRDRLQVYDIPPLCDYDPPLHFAWPEYVDTARGRDWHIPVSPN